MTRLELAHERLKGAAVAFAHAEEALVRVESVAGPTLRDARAAAEARYFDLQDAAREIYEAAASHANDVNLSKS